MVQSIARFCQVSETQNSLSKTETWQFLKSEFSVLGVLGLLRGFLQRGFSAFSFFKMEVKTHTTHKNLHESEKSSRQTQMHIGKVETEGKTTNNNPPFSISQSREKKKRLVNYCRKLIYSGFVSLMLFWGLGFLSLGSDVATDSPFVFLLFGLMVFAFSALLSGGLIVIFCSDN